MTFLSPAFFYASLAVAAAIVALHLIVTRQPRAAVLPTARFVPDLPATATARATRPSDLLLMLLRVLMVLAIGIGLARPVFTTSRKPNARVIVVDRSRSVGDVSAVRDSALDYYREGDAVILFDSASGILTSKAVDSLRALRSASLDGKLSGALISAARAGSVLRDRADSLELVIISPLDADEFDAATDSIRSLWHGRATIVRAGARASVARPVSRPEIRGATGDPLAITVSRLEAREGNAKIIRDGLTASDLSSVNTNALVDWPVSSRPKGAVVRSKTDTIGGAATDSFIVVSAFSRHWTFSQDSIRGARVIARWTDGEPAAVEWPLNQGCVRSVIVPVNPIGDFALQRSFAKFVSAIASSCLAQRQTQTASAAQIAALRGSGGLASRNSFEPRGDLRSSFSPWLLALGLTAAIAELFVRRRRRDEDQSVVRGVSRIGKAA